MGTATILGALLTVISVLILAFMFIGARNPKTPWWAGETVMTWILPLVTGAIIIGPGLLVEGFVFSFNTLGSRDIIISLTLLGAGAGILVLMRIPKKIAAFEAAEKGTLQGVA